MTRIFQPLSYRRIFIVIETLTMLSLFYLFRSLFPSANDKPTHMKHIHTYIYIHFSCLHSSNGRYFIRGDIDPPRIYTDTYQLPLGDGRLAKQANERYIPGRQSIARIGFIWRSVVSLKSRSYRFETRQVTHSPQQVCIKKNKVKSDSNQVWLTGGYSLLAV